MDEKKLESSWLHDQLMVIRGKIHDRLPETLDTIRRNYYEWWVNPASLLGEIGDQRSTAQCSFKSLERPFNKNCKFARPLHEVNLHLILEEEGEFSKNRFNNKVFHYYAELDRAEKSRLNNQTQSHLKAAPTLVKFLHCSSGLLLIVASVLTHSELLMLFNDDTWSWLSTEVLAEALKYQSLCSRLLLYVRIGSPSKTIQNVVWKDDRMLTSSIHAQHFDLFCKLLNKAGGSIPSDMLKRLEPQLSRWNDDLEQTPLTAINAFVDEDLLAITTYNVASWFLQSRIIDGHQDYCLAVGILDFVHRSISAMESMRLESLIVAWVCFVFPRYGIEENEAAAATAEALAPILLRATDRWSIPICLRDHVLEALLSASHLIPSSRKYILGVASELESNESAQYLRLDLLLQRSQMLRLAGEPRHANDVFHNSFCQCLQPQADCIPRYFGNLSLHDGTKREWSLHDRLWQSYLENLLQDEQYDRALQLCKIYDVRTDSLTSFILTRCRIWRAHGMFEEMQTTLTGLLDQRPFQGSSRVQILCLLTEATSNLVALAKSSHQNKAFCTQIENLKRVQILLAQEVKNTRGNSKNRRRLLVCLVETNLLVKVLKTPDKTFQTIEAHFNALESMDVTDQWLHVRCSIASARYNDIEHRYDIVSAIEKWKTACLHLQRYSTFRRPGFTHYAVNLSIRILELRDGSRKESQHHLVPPYTDADYSIPTLWSWVKLLETTLPMLLGQNQREVACGM